MNGKSGKKQHGVALLLALGFLSLLLATGIAFVTNTMVARKSAANFQFHTQARTQALSAANRLVAGIRYSLEKKAEGEDYLDPAQMTSVSNAAETDDDAVLKDKDSLLTSTVWGVKFIPESLHSDHLPRWEYQYDRYDSSGNKTADAKIIGRVAYMALTPSATINFSEVLRGANDIDNGSWSKWDRRRGFGIRELKIDLPPSEEYRNKLLARFTDETFEDAANKQDFAKSKSDATVAASKNRTENITDYQDYDTIFANGNLTDSAAQNRLKAWFMPSGYNEPEIFAFNPDTKNDGYNEKTRFYHRLNLARLDSTGKSVWESTAVEDARLTVETLLGQPERFNERIQTHPVTRALPYLKSIVGADSSFDAELRRKQIAANLIDYCDTDSVPTSDSTNWEENAPNYTGNEKTPYINEIMLRSSVTVTRTYQNTGTTDAPVHSNKLEIKIAPENLTLELINLYGTDFANLKFLAEGEIVVKYLYGEEEERSQTIAWSLPMTDFSGFSPESSTHYAYKSVAFGEFESSDTVDVDGVDKETPISFKVKEIKLKVTRIYLERKRDDSETYDPADYVRTLEVTINKDSEGSSLPSADMSLASGTPTTQYLYTGFGVDDPRHNLYMGEGSYLNWTPQYFIPGLDFDSMRPANEIGTGSEDWNFSIADKNNFCEPEKSGDRESFGSFSSGAMLSTAYIANRPIQAIAELGMIHRADKWATINLKKAESRIGHANYNPEREGNEAGGYTYEQGDAALLDQVKLTDLVFTAGKVNLNRYPESTAQNFLFKALFDNIAYRVDHADIYEGLSLSDRVSSGAAGEIRDVLGGSERTGINQFLMSRGHMVDFLAEKCPAVFLQGSTDVQKEIIPAASSALTSSYSTSPNIIQYVIVAQAIQDVGTKDGISVYKPKADGSLKKKTGVKLGVFDYDSADKVYYDEIVGEAKLLVTVQIDTENKKAKIIRTEFLD